jgi:hypothetical protein
MYCVRAKMPAPITAIRGSPARPSPWPAMFSSVPGLVCAVPPPPRRAVANTGSDLTSLAEIFTLKTTNSEMERNPTVQMFFLVVTQRLTGLFCCLEICERHWKKLFACPRDLPLHSSFFCQSSDKELSLFSPSTCNRKSVSS